MNQSDQSAVIVPARADSSAAKMTGPQHYREAERLLLEARETDISGASTRVYDEAGKVDMFGVGERDRARRLTARAHVHATLALAAAAYDGLADVGSAALFGGAQADTDERGGEPAVHALADELDEGVRA